jgi:hypothetical protein
MFLVFSCKISARFDVHFERCLISQNLLANILMSNLNLTLFVVVSEVDRVY